MKAVKKVLVVVMCLTVGLVMMTGCGSEANGGAEKEDTSKATIGYFEAEIKGCEVKQDDEGHDAVFVTFEFTNNSEENISFDNALYGECFQNGVELDFADVYIGEDTTDPAYENAYKDIQPGTTIEVKEAYVLQDKENPITVKVVSMEEIMGGESEGYEEKELQISNE